MPLGSVPHLFPCVSPMAVRTQQAEVPCIGRPVAESVAPRSAPALVSHFLRRVNVVNIKNSMVGLSAHGTLSAKLGYQRQLSRPVSWAAVLFVSRTIPVFISTSRRAVFVLCLFPAYVARLARTPSVSEVTSITAKFAVALLNPIGANLKRFSAMTANAFNLSVLSHNITIRAVAMLSLYPEYCAIAERRIAQQVLDLVVVQGQDEAQLRTVPLERPFGRKEE